MVDIRINRRVTEDVLHALAEAIRSSDETEYGRTFLTCHLPDMKIGAGAWATTHYTPELEVTILGTTAEEYAALQESAEADLADEIIGSCFYESPYASRKLVLFQEGDQYTMESTFKDGSTMTEVLIEKKSSRRGLRLDPKEGSDFGEFYIVAKNGNLEMWDSEGLIDSARKQESE